MDRNRQKALITARKVLFQGLKMKEAMSGSISGSAGVDRAFIMELVYGCVRYKIYLEWVLKNFIKDISRLDENTFTNLMLGIYQLEFMRVSEWAAVHETVEIEKNMKGKPSLVNAVLRNYIRQKGRLKLPALSQDPVSHISISTSHPDWLVRRWLARFGPDETYAFARSNNEIPPFAVRVNILCCDTNQISSILHSRNIDFDPARYVPDGIIMRHIPFESVSDLMSCMAVQDEAAQVIGWFLDPRSGETILDACAAPGGKTAHIAQITRNEAKITAVERDPVRMELLRENLLTLGASSAEPVLSDILGYRPGFKFDRILVDAPCSALGVIRRNPDVKYRYRPGMLKEFGERQLEILVSCSENLRSGGTMVYSVCSTEPEETSRVIESFLNNSRDFFIINAIDDIRLQEPFKTRLQTLIDGNGYLYTYPHIHNMDGFFAVRLRRK